MSKTAISSKLLENCLDWVYPRKCALCGLLNENAICDICYEDFKRLDQSVNYDSGLGSLDYWVRAYYYQGRVAQAVQRIKYDRVTSLAGIMSELLLKVANETDLLSADYIIPVPIHWKRKFERGFNQSELILKNFNQQQIRPNLLKRTRYTVPQVSLRIQERLHNLKGCFTASDQVQNQNILLIDDVVTSGGTANGCAESLKKAGAKNVGILSFAGRP